MEQNIVRQNPLIYLEPVASLVMMAQALGSAMVQHHDAEEDC
jgi:hypothetical protein